MRELSTLRWWSRVWRRLQRLARAIRGLFPFTAVGLLLLLLALGSFVLLGIGALDLVVLAAAGLGLGLAALVLLLVAAAAGVLHLRVRRQPAAAALRLESGRLQPTGWRLPFPRWLPLVETSWGWEHPPEVSAHPRPGRGGTLEEVLPARRGEWLEVRRRLEVRDVMGLVALSWTVRAATHVRVEPSRGGLDNLPLLDTLAGGEELSEPRGQPLGDRVDMRQYTHGDSPRLILWKVYARTRKLLVRIPERAVTARPRACAYFVAGDGDEATAGLARVMVERGFLGDNWWFGADGSERVASDPQSALDLLVASGLAIQTGEAGAGGTASPPTRLGEFLARVEKAGFGVCLVFLPARPGAWTPHVAAALAGARLRTQLYTALDDADTRLPAPSRLSRWLLRPAPPGPPTWAEVTAMASAFTALGAPMLAVDRRNGRLLGDPRLAAARARRTA
ncbi:MAG TPA: DUF58 domain-containing protein [Thermoanaerobaculaceae bacterium]|nr:DUF58 domain-containing protein [Thermoanaerobaculaceae bacterium]HRS17392.1 DUF58 domain-containing protein [Thermoanaerobaculaceae bacterium]